MLLGDAVESPFGQQTTGGVSDANHTAALGIPTLDGLGPVGGDDHSPREYIERSSIAPRCGVVAGLIVAINEGLLDSL
jgi:glutamate carboxypeptidase